MVARLRSAILTVEDMGIGQARIQRSQPMHISISKRTSCSVKGRKSVRCSIPTTRDDFFEDCICIMPPQTTFFRRTCHRLYRTVHEGHSPRHSGDRWCLPGATVQLAMKLWTLQTLQVEPLSVVCLLADSSLPHR